jgi:hypothetical protein
MTSESREDGFLGLSVLSCFQMLAGMLHACNLRAYCNV